MKSKKNTDRQINEDKGKFLMASLTIIMTGTIFIYFLWSVINAKYIINFSVDAIVGAISFVILIRNLKLKYNILKKYNELLNNYKFIDLSSFVICLFIKIFVKIPFDFSLVILLCSYYITKNKFYKNLS